MDKNQATGFERLLRILGLFLIGKGLLYWLSLVGIMYAYAERGIINNYSRLFFFSVLFFTAIIILGIYFLDLGAISVSRDLKKRVISLRKDIPGRKVAVLLGLEFLGSIFILMNIPELPRLWICFIVEFITLVWAIGRGER